MRFDNNLWADIACVRCETCNRADGLHLRATRTDLLGFVVSIGPAGIEQFDEREKNTARGSRVEIDFTCEFGNHPFTARFEFYKGTVQYRTIFPRPLPPLDVNGPDFDTELPRA